MAESPEMAVDVTVLWGGSGHTWASLPVQPRGTAPFPGVSELAHPLAFALPLSRSHVSPPRFFCKIASHLFFTFTFLIHLEFVWIYLSRVQFHFLPDGGSLVPAPFISQSTLFPPN